MMTKPNRKLFRALGNEDDDTIDLGALIGYHYAPAN